MTYEKAELERILAVQRGAFLREGDASATVRRERVSRMALAILENIDAIADTLSVDYGYRPSALTKAFEGTTWPEDIQRTLDSLEQWMAPVKSPEGFVQQKPKGVVGVMGTWNFPIILAFEPAMEALAAGNRVMINFSDFHPRTGDLLARILNAEFPEEEVAFIHGDVVTAQRFSELRFDHLFFTGSPKIGSLVSQAAARNLVPVSMELGGKNPVVVARDADLDLAASRIAATRMLNAGQVCLCPDYVFVPAESLQAFLGKLQKELTAFFPHYLYNPNVVTIVNAANFNRVVGLIEDAVEKGAQKLSVACEGEVRILPDHVSRRIPPTILLNVPETARIAHEEVFGPVLVVYPYSNLEEAIEYINVRHSPLAAYWYGQDSEEFRHFLNKTTSGGVTRNDGVLHFTLPGAPFGGVGNSGSGAYHGRAGFDTFTHRRTVANVTHANGVANDLVNGALLTEQSLERIEATIQNAIEGFRVRVGTPIAA
jgi:coniferyl-aldehyde dehydrogenase